MPFGDIHFRLNQQLPVYRGVWVFFTMKLYFESWNFRRTFLIIYSSKWFEISIYFFMSNLAGVSRKAEDAYHTDAPSPCSHFSGVRVAHLLLLLCILVTLCSLLCVSVFHVWSLSLDYILLITAITLVPLITLSPRQNKWEKNYPQLFQLFRHIDLMIHI